jgi:O-6-methylguanine DNA methyltransferase
MQGTDFQKTVWRQLTKVAHGQTASYGEIAAAIGNPAASRAVGHANGRNPIAIIVPCHRIIGTDGSLTGYGGGLWRKEWLLHHERDKH